MQAIILAGGLGTRLKPYTTNFPKPLMPVGDKPILELVINQLKEAGITEIILSVGHLSELLFAYFGNGEKWGVNISYSKESEPLGTAGPLNLIRDSLQETFILMNGDVLSDINFEEFISFHKDTSASATVAITKRSVDIDFGVIELKDETLIDKWQEKPKIDYNVSTGIYLVSKTSLSTMPKKGFYNLPDFIIDLKESGKIVQTYYHDGYWLDIGREDDYQKACIDMSMQE